MGWNKLAGIGKRHSRRVRAVAVNGSEIYAGGDPFRQGNTFAVYLSEWDGSVWKPIGTTDSPAAGSVGALTLCGSDIYAGGGFVWMNGMLVRGIAKWDGANWSALGSGLAQGGSGVLACNGTELFVGGQFTGAGGKPSTNIALWHIPHSLSISQTGNQMSLSWPATGTNFVLEAKDDATATKWSEVSQPCTLHNNECVVTDTIGGPQKVYRLRKK